MFCDYSGLIEPMIHFLIKSCPLRIPLVTFFAGRSLSSCHPHPSEHIIFPRSTHCKNSRHFLMIPLANAMVSSYVFLLSIYTLFISAHLSSAATDQKRTRIEWPILTWIERREVTITYQISLSPNSIFNMKAVQVHVMSQYIERSLQI